VPTAVVLQELPFMIDVRRLLDEAEISWISKARESLCQLTNLTDGGRGIRGFIPTDVQKEKTAKSHRGRKRPPETGRRISLAKTGQKYEMNWTAEKSRKASERRKGINRGPKSEETKRKISESLKGRPPALKGRKMSEQGRQNLIASWVRRKERKCQ
jgi:hypothetical protein